MQTRKAGDPCPACDNLQGKPYYTSQSGALGKMLEKFRMLVTSFCLILSAKLPIKEDKHRLELWQLEDGGGGSDKGRALPAAHGPQGLKPWACGAYEG